MEAVRRIVEDAPEEIIVSIPPEWRHRRVQVVLSTLEGSDLMGTDSELPPYRVLKVRRRVIAGRDALHER
jgi:hypothetical protein